MNKLRSLFGRVAPLLGFRSSGEYWEKRYKMGGHSGEGSRGESARYKAEVINRFVQRHQVESIIEFGCGDGYQLRMLDIPNYIGVDVSPTVLDQCRAIYSADESKTFIHDREYAGERADLAMSIDVIFHLVEDDIYDEYLSKLFAASGHYVIIYSTSVDMKSTGTPHVRHRDVAQDVAVRFPGFARMLAEECELPPPVRFDRGHPTVFSFYERSDASTKNMKTEA